jgi:hypothetical protein
MLWEGLVSSRLRPFPRRGRISLTLIAATCSAGLAVPASVPAAVTIGQTAPGPGTIAGCQGGTLWAQQEVTAPPVYTVPEGGGVLTSWSVQGANFASGPVKLKLVRRAADGTSYAIVAEDSFQPVAQGVLNTYAARIPVTGGEILSLWLQTSAACYFSAADGNSVRYRSGGPYPEPSVGEVFATNIEQTFARLNVSAVVEPDCDNDGLGDETQDLSLFGGSCPARGRFVTLDANKNKVKKGKKVTLTGSITEQARAGECQGGQTVELQRKKASRTSFTTFTQVQTDSQGGFSLKRKVKKTLEYRAQVVETASCAAALSNSEKVKVKKKKK